MHSCAEYSQLTALAIQPINLRHLASCRESPTILIPPRCALLLAERSHRQPKGASWLAHVSRLRTSKELENSEKWNKEMMDRKRVFKLESRVKAALDTCRLHQASHRRGRRKRHDRLRSLYKGKSVSLTTHNFLLFLRTIIFLIKLLCAFLLFFFVVKRGSGRI